MTVIESIPVPGRVKGKSTALKAISDLDGLISIARREQLKQGIYVSHNVDQELKDEGAICGGRQACLVGSLYLAHGVKPELTGDTARVYDENGEALRDEEGLALQFDEWKLPGVEPDERDDYMHNRAGLRLAYQYLDAAAYNYCVKHHKDNLDELREDRWSSYPPDCGWGEYLFETILDPDEISRGKNWEPLTQQEIAEHKARVQKVIIQVARSAKRQLEKDHEAVLSG